MSRGQELTQEIIESIYKCVPSLKMVWKFKIKSFMKGMKEIEHYKNKLCAIVALWTICPQEEAQRQDSVHV